MITKKKLLSFLKFIISLALIWYIASKIDWNKAISNIENANIFYIILTFVLIFFERVQLTYKWNLLIRVRGIITGFWRLFIINSIGAFWGLFLPSSIGSDVAKSYYLIKNNSEKSVSISSVFVDRILGILALLVLSIFSLLIADDLITQYSLKVFVFIFFLIFLLLVYFFQLEKTYNIFEKIFKKIGFKNITDKFLRLHFSVLEYKKHPKTIFVTFILTLLVNVTRVLIFYVISVAYSIPIPIIYFFIFVPILTVVIMIPISIGGLGVGEGAFITFFALVGVSMNDSIIVVLTNTLSNTVFTILGGIFILFDNFKQKNVKLNYEEVDN